LLNPPPPPKLPQHNNTPSEPRRRVSRDGYVDWSTDPASDDDYHKKIKVPRLKKGQSRGRKWDHLRTAEPVIVTGHSAEPASKWRDFIQSSTYGRMDHEETTVVDPEYLNQLQPSFNQPFDMPQPSEKPKERVTLSRLWKILVQHPLVPLGFRIAVLLTSIMALALSVRIYELENANKSDTAERTQAVVAIVVDCVAVPYIGYMTWDEYVGMPLGLRSASQKASLVLMDLFFIIFKAASTALSFEALVYHNSKDDRTLHFSRALTAFMLVGLVSWSLTFTVNVFRLVDKLNPHEEQQSMKWKLKAMEDGLA